MLELRIKIVDEKQLGTKIHWNHEELKQAIAEKMQEYEGLVFTAETINEAKKDRANLRKLKDAFENERKRIKKLCLEQYELFEKQVKEVTSLIDRQINGIDVQVKEYEEMKRQEKLLKISQYYHEHIGSLKGLIPIERVLKDEYLNSSKTLKSVFSEIDQFIVQVNKDLDVIDELKTVYDLQVKDMYVKSFDLGMALRENNRLIEMEQKLKERKEQENKKQFKECEWLDSDTKQPIETKKTDLKVTMVSICFRVTGTEQQLLGVRDYLKENNIAYERM